MRDHRSEPGRRLAGEELREQPLRIRRGQGLEPDRVRRRARAEAGLPLVQLGPSRPDHEQWPAYGLEHLLEQVEERILGPVQILHEQRDGPFGSELGK